MCRPALLVLAVLLAACSVKTSTPTGTPAASVAASENASPLASVAPASAWSIGLSMTPNCPGDAGLSLDSATLMLDGRVLVTGVHYSQAGGLPATCAALFDPRSNSWAPATALTPICEGPAVLLGDGRVLVAGRDISGGPTVGDAVPCAHLYDPVAAGWSATGSPTTWHVPYPYLGRIGPLTGLADGRILAIGGCCEGFEIPDGADEGGVMSASVYDPKTGKWTATGSMAIRRLGFTATLLPDGRVLVAGGYLRSDYTPEVISTAELYDPGTGDWATTGSMITARELHTATLLADGTVLVVGGSGSVGERSSLGSAEIYHPDTGKWTATGANAFPRVRHTATLLADGRVLVIGGDCDLGQPNCTSGLGLEPTELYDQSTQSWSQTAPLTVGIHFHQAILLSDGRVLVVWSDGGPWNVEFYTP